MTIRARTRRLSPVRTVCLLLLRVTWDGVTGDTGVLAVYRQHMRVARLSEATIQTRLLVLQIVARHAGQPVEYLSGDDLFGWQASLGLLADSTVQTYVSHVRTFYGWLAETGRREDNPARVLRRLRTPEGEPTPIPEWDLARALEKLPQVVRLWVMLAAFCGLRAAEIAGLSRADVLEREDPPMLRVVGKGKKVRRVKLPASVAAELAAFGLPVRGRLFRRDDGSPETGRHVSATANRWLHRIGVADPLHHGRHRYATKLLDHGANLRIVQEALGHASPATTARYTRVLPRAAAPYVDAIDHPLIGE